MLYAISPASLLILNLILNWELLTNYGFNARKQDKKNLVHVRPETDSFVSEIFERADKEMYEDKKKLKANT
jgi:hypothetical protein